MSTNSVQKHYETQIQGGWHEQLQTTHAVFTGIKKKLKWAWNCELKVGTKSVVMMTDIILTIGCTHCDVATMLPKDNDDDTVSYDVPQ